MNCIISDARSSDISTNTGRNTALKTGILFPGCIYGIVGDADSARSFIRGFKEVARANPNIEINSMWSSFISYSESYTYDREAGREFTLILSERSDGKPKLFMLRSEHGKLSQNPYSEETQFRPLSFGSGADLMKAELKSKIGPKIMAFSRFAIEELGQTPEATIRILPYVFCVFLNELTLGENRVAYERKGVGGVFHFMIQTFNGEARQKSAWYAITRFDEHGNGTDGLVGLNGIVPLSAGIGVITTEPSARRMILLDGHADYEWIEPSQERAEKLKAEFSAADEHVYFCGIGFAQADYQNSFPYIVECSKSDILNDDGSPSGWLEQRLHSAIQRKRIPK